MDEHSMKAMDAALQMTDAALEAEQVPVTEVPKLKKPRPHYFTDDNGNEAVSSEDYQNLEIYADELASRLTGIRELTDEVVG